MIYKVCQVCKLCRLYEHDKQPYSCRFSTMIQIEDTIVSFDIFVKKFCCDLAQCRGICCVEGDSGAPLEEDEPVRIETNYENIRAYMKPEGIAAVEEQGFSVIDQEGDLVTPLIQGGA